MVIARGMLNRALWKFLDRLLHESEELVCHRTVDHSMVERDREIGTRANRDGVFAVSTGNDFRTLLDRADAHDSDLWLIDDWRAHQRSEHARIGDRERTVLHFFGGELLRPR